MTATIEAARLAKLFIHTDPHAHAFAWSHYQAGHRYTVMGDKGSMSVECQCGKRYVAGSNTVEYP